MMSSKSSPPEVSNLPESFTGAYLKIGRAEKHILELRTLIEEFEVENDGAFSVTKNGDGQFVLDFKALGELGEQVPVVLGDAIHNLRCALDHIWTALDRAATGKSATFASFPFDKTRQNLVARIKGTAVNDAFPDVQRLILDNIKTHRDEGGDSILWSLTKLDKLDKHNLLIPTVVVRHVQHLEVCMGSSKFEYVNCSFSNIGVIGASDTAIEYKCHGKVSVDPIFRDLFSVARQSVLPTLDKLKLSTKNAVDLFREQFSPRWGA